MYIDKAKNINMANGSKAATSLYVIEMNPTNTAIAIDPLNRSRKRWRQMLPTKFECTTFLNEFIFQTTPLELVSHKIFNNRFFYIHALYGFFPSSHQPKMYGKIHLDISQSFIFVFRISSPYQGVRFPK
jgi:hypothetical protein